MREKQIEQKFKKQIEAAGGLCIKLPAIYFAGLPDRLVLLPGGKMYFAELKAQGRKPTKIQSLAHEKLKSLGFEVKIIDKISAGNIG